MEPYRVGWCLSVTAPNPTEAARSVLALQQSKETTTTTFTVTDAAGVVHEINLGSDNPLGRPAATVEGDEVCCGHCGSGDTRYVEDVGQYAPLWARFGVAFADGGDLSADDDGNDPRVWCLDCNRESELPPSFQWA